jgi:hypothetical protein
VLQLVCFLENKIMRHRVLITLQELEVVTILKTWNQGNTPKLVDIPQTESHHCQSQFQQFLN